ncbi:hypothetical protein AHAS_Ahas01G0055600 [Arachis hypogaea]
MTSSSLHPSSNSGVSAAAPLRPFRLPQSKLRPEPQTANGVQVTKLCNEDMDPEANEHKRRDGTYIHEDAQRIGVSTLNQLLWKKISEIEQLDETKRILSENDSLAQTLGKERSGRVRGIDFGPTPSQLFCPSSQPSVDRAQTEETPRMLFELQAEVTAENLRRKTMEDKIAAKKIEKEGNGG